MRQSLLQPDPDRAKPNRLRNGMRFLCYGCLPMLMVVLILVYAATEALSCSQHGSIGIDGCTCHEGFTGDHCDLPAPVDPNVAPDTGPDETVNTQATPLLAIDGPISDGLLLITVYDKCNACYCPRILLSAYGNHPEQLCQIEHHYCGRIRRLHPRQSSLPARQS